MSSGKKPSVQVPEFWQGFEAHSGMSISQNVFVHPGWQSHSIGPSMSFETWIQFPSFLQGIESQELMIILSEQSSPSKSGGHSHFISFTKSTQVLPL
jgi:hypothetical protein